MYNMSLVLNDPKHIAHVISSLFIFCDYILNMKVFTFIDIDISMICTVEYMQNIFL